MKVRVSTEAQWDIAKEVAYLRGKTNSGIVRFRDLIKRGEALLKDNPHAGFTESEVPILGAKRIILDGWYFDYDIIGDTVLIQRITSSINTPILGFEDDSDYEA